MIKRNTPLVLKAALLWLFLCLAAGAPIVISAPDADVDLAITKTDSVDPAIAGEALTYRISISNAGPFTATGVAITDTLPGGLTYTSASSGCTYNPGSRTVRCALGEVGVGSVTSATVQVRIDPATTGSLLNRATVATLDTDTNANNNSAQATTTITSSADLSGAMTAPLSVIAGDTITYTLAISNTGPSDARGVVLRDDFPAGTSYTRSSLPCTLQGQQLTCTLAGVAANTRRTETITLLVDPGRTGTLSNNALVSATTPDPNATNNNATLTTPVVISSDLTISKSGAPEPVFAGRSLTYHLQISNHGPSRAEGVNVVDNLPTAVSFVSAPAGCTHSNGSVNCNLGRMQPGASSVVTITVNVNLTALDLISNIASLSSDTNDPVNTNNQSEWITRVLAPDNQIPTVTWTQPVLNGERLNVGCQTLRLQVSATDNVAVQSVRFYRWDTTIGTSGGWVDIGTDTTSPYQWDINTCTLPAKWNQVFAQAQDTYGNLSLRQFIWLYRYVMFMPVITK